MLGSASWNTFSWFIWLRHRFEIQFITSKLSSPNSRAVGCSRPKEWLSPFSPCDLNFCPCCRQNMCYHRKFRFWQTGIFHLSGVLWQALHNMHFSHTWTLHAIHWWLWLLHKECNRELSLRFFPGSIQFQPGYASFCFWVINTYKSLLTEIKCL